MVLPDYRELGITTRVKENKFCWPSGEFGSHVMDDGKNPWGEPGAKEGRSKGGTCGGDEEDVGLAGHEGRDLPVVPGEENDLPGDRQRGARN